MSKAKVAANQNGTKPSTENKGKSMAISDSEFIMAWQSSESVDEVVQRLRGENGKGPSKVQVQAMATRYRKYKVPLKQMPRGKNGSAEKRYAPLRELAEQLLAAQKGATVGERVEV